MKPVKVMYPANELEDKEVTRLYQEGKLVYGGDASLMFGVEKPEPKPKQNTGSNTV